MADIRLAQDQKMAVDLRDTLGRRRNLASYLTWGGIAVSAVLAAAVSVALVVNAHRTGSLIQQARTPAAPTQANSEAQASQAKVQKDASSTPQRTQPSLEREVGRLQDAVRSLAAERDRLEARMQQLERQIGAVTASITTGSIVSGPRPEVTASTPTNDILTSRASQSATAQPALNASSPEALLPPAAPPADVVMPKERPGGISGMARQGSKAAPQVTASLGAKDRTPPQPGASVATRTEFGIDLGGDATIDALRALWANLRGNHGTELDGLRPLVNVREVEGSGAVELRLIAGPLANAGDAARICASLQTKGIGCRTTEFDGQRLALR